MASVKETCMYFSPNHVVFFNPNQEVLISNPKQVLLLLKSNQEVTKVFW